MSFQGIDKEACKNSSTTYLALLRSLPPIRMGQNEVDIALDRSPELRRMSILNVSPRAPIEVTHKICQYFYSGFILGKGGYVVIVDVSGGQTFRTEMEFPPISQELVSMRHKYKAIIGS